LGRCQLLTYCIANRSFGRSYASKQLRSKSHFFSADPGSDPRDRTGAVFIAQVFPDPVEQIIQGKHPLAIRLLSLCRYRVRTRPPSVAGAPSHFLRWTYLLRSGATAFFGMSLSSVALSIFRLLRQPDWLSLSIATLRTQQRSKIKAATTTLPPSSVDP
jgi:hypothetical protein